MMNFFLKIFCFFCLMFSFISAYPDNKIILPAHLQLGDTVGLVSSASRAPEDADIQYAIERLEAIGLKVKLGKAIYKRDNYFAGTDEERAADLNNMFADPTVKAIFEVRGGYGSTRILPYLNYAAIKEHPKIFIGLSDITALLLGIHMKTGLVTFHGPLGIKPWPTFSVNYLKQVLFAPSKVVFTNPIKIDPEKDIIQTENRIHVIRGGIAKGQLMGGNLTLITSMLGTPYLPQWKGKILFLEDTGVEYNHEFDRLMQQLEAAGVLKQISGFVFGQCTDCTTQYLKNIRSPSIDEILTRYIAPLNIPAWSGAMIGHMPEIFTLPEGTLVQIDADKGSITMLEPAVS